MLGIDVDRAAAVPAHTDAAVVVDVLDDSTVAGTELGLRGVAHELDPRSDGHARLDAGREETCAKGIHEPGYRLRRR